MEQAIVVREAAAADAPALSAILNAIVSRGGTTAHQAPFTVEAFRDAFLRGSSHLLCLVACGGRDGVLLGFQHLERHPDLPPDWADIATFARAEPKVRGVGRALFARTKSQAVALGAATINATIRADNREGLGYYDAMGFRTHRTDPAVPLADGTLVDRVSKRFDLIS